MSTTLVELMRHLGAHQTVTPVVEIAYHEVLARKHAEGGEEPHGRPWHVSFHASSFPGDNQQACGRLAMYGLMDIPEADPPNEWLTRVSEAGKDIELSVVRKVRDFGKLARSNQPGRSSDPDARLPDGKPAPQMGFVDVDHWLTGSVDMPMLPFNAESTHIVEIKTKHESKIDAMKAGDRSYDAKHRNQLLCSLGLAHEHPQDFLHPTEDRLLLPAQDGSIFYNARDTDWPGPPKRHEFFFSYDPAFMEAGRAHLKKWVGYFQENQLPATVSRKNSRSHPFGWKWSEGICKYCPLKKACKQDYEEGITDLTQSNTVALAQSVMPDYDPQDKRNTVLDFWNKERALA